jgi:hypothetical protein
MAAEVPEPPIKRHYPTEALVFDTETEPGPAQRVRLVVWRLYRDASGEPPGHHCVEEGIAYPDDLPERDPEGFALLTAHAPTIEADVAPGMGGAGSQGGLVIKPLSWWLEDRLYRYGYRHRDRCHVVGFNLPFDLGGIAKQWGPATKTFRGGWKLGIWGEHNSKGKWKDARYHPSLYVKAIDPRRSFFRWGTLRKGDAPDIGEGRFVDLRTLAFALTDRSYNLEGACKAFGDDWEKVDVDYEQISPELIDYAIEDVRHTGLLYRNTLDELAEHPGIGLEPHRLYSPATVGARYLEAMRLQRPLEKFTSLTRAELGWTEPWQRPEKPREIKGGISGELLGYAMSAFYGGRAEARIVRTPVPVVHVDFTSMYPAVNALLGTWKLLRAKTARTIEVTAEVRELLAVPGLLDRCLTRQLWERVGVTFVEIEPDGDILPVRATYDPDSDDFGIGLNPLTYEGRLWYALPDVIAATLLGGNKPPEIARAIRIEGEGSQDGLVPVKLRGHANLDPTGDRDPFLAMIEERARVKADKTLSKEKRNRLELFLKITANATAYGSLARFDRRDLPKPRPVVVRGPDAEARTARLATPEDPGPYCFPPVAASITAAARLMLAILERLLTEAGGSYAFCDTDSMAILATETGGQVRCETSTGDTIPALSWQQVQEILDRFATLNPYTTVLLEPWKVEHDSLAEQLHCYAISAKRYVLYRQGPDGTPILLETRDSEDAPADETTGEVDPLADWSEHGLGLYLDPTGDTVEQPARDKQGRRIWIRDTWRWILARAYGHEADQPAWADRYALTRFTVANPGLAKWFDGYNRSQPREQQVRPGNFGLIAHPTAGFDAEMKPTTTYESKPERWQELAWYDRATAEPMTVTTPQARADPEAFAAALQEGAVVIDTLAQVLGRYTRRPEHKSISPNGEPTTGQTHGELQRRSVTAHPAHTVLTGKEGNKITERLTGEVDQPSDYRNDYGTRADFWPLVTEVLRDAGVPALIGAGIGRSTAYAALNGARPRAHASTCIAVACQHSSELLRVWGSSVPDEPAIVLVTYLREREQREAGIRRCAWCGEPLSATARVDARYHSPACRQAARRAAQQE